MWDNYDLFKQQDRQTAKEEYINEKLSGIEQAIDDIITICDDYDTEDNEDLCNRLEKIRTIVGKIDTGI